MPYENQQIQLIQLIRLLRMAWYFSKIMRDLDEELGFILSAVVTTLIFTLLVDALLKQIHLAYRLQKPLQDEIQLTHQKPAFFKNTYDVQAKLSCVHLIPNQPFQWHYYYIHNTGEHYKILIDTKSRALAQHIQRLYTLSLELDKQLSNPTNHNFTSLRLLNVPTLYGYVGPLSIAHALHVSAGCDMPSKSRAYELSVALPKIMNYFKNFITLGNPTFPIEDFIVSMLTLREGYLLNQQNIGLAYTGIQRRITPHHAFPPTCIGQQLVAQHLFVGDSKTLHQHIKFLIDMIHYIEQLECRMNAWEKDLHDIPCLEACIDTKREAMSFIQSNPHTPTTSLSATRLYI